MRHTTTGKDWAQAMTVPDAEPYPADFPESQTRYTDPADPPGSWQLLLVPVLTCLGLMIFMLAAG